MKGKGKQDILSPVAFELRSEDRLGQGKRVPDVQVSVRVWIRKGNHEGLDVGIWVSLIGIQFLPLLLDGNFIGPQGIALGSALWCRRGHGQIFHLFRRNRGHCYGRSG